MYATYFLDDAMYYNWGVDMYLYYNSPLCVSYFRWHEVQYQRVMAELLGRPAGDIDVVDSVAQRITHGPVPVYECVECYTLIPQPNWPHSRMVVYFDEGIDEGIDVDAQ